MGINYQQLTNTIFSSNLVHQVWWWSECVWIMPVASQQKDPQVVQYRRLLPKPPIRHNGHHHHQLVEGAENVCLSDDTSLSEDLCLSEELWHVDSAINQIIDAHASVHRNDLATGGVDPQQQCHLISTHSPPIINLSPNLSPSSDHHRISPVYDLRESTRRRSTQGRFTKTFSYSYGDNADDNYSTTTIITTAAVVVATAATTATTTTSNTTTVYAWIALIIKLSFLFLHSNTQRNILHKTVITEMYTVMCTQQKT